MEHNRKLARWWMLLQEFDYRLEYVTGKYNLVADGLSRLTDRCDEVVGEADTLGSSLPVVLSLQSDVDNTVTYSCCGKTFDSSDQECTEVWLPFVYCKSCMNENKSDDVTMNLDLLKMLVAQDGKELIADIGVERFFELNSRRSSLNQQEMCCIKCLRIKQKKFLLFIGENLSCWTYIKAADMLEL